MQMTMQEKTDVALRFLRARGYTVTKVRAPREGVSRDASGRDEGDDAVWECMRRRASEVASVERLPTRE